MINNDNNNRNDDNDNKDSNNEDNAISIIMIMIMIMTIMILMMMMMMMMMIMMMTMMVVIIIMVKMIISNNSNDDNYDNNNNNPVLWPPFLQWLNTACNFYYTYDIAHISKRLFWELLQPRTDLINNQNIFQISTIKLSNIAVRIHKSRGRHLSCAKYSSLTWS